ncbi:MAG: SUMF1/EgtB/PvdO family nonheme iron enzyme [Gammaproteobacteria bacterium]
MQFLFEIAGDQINGARDYQEDAFLTSYVDDQTGDSSGKSAALIIVADGMGGHAAGNIASNLVVSTFSKNFTSNYRPDTISPVLRQSLEQANKAIRESIDETPALHGMGCTMVGAFVRRGKLNWVSVGDSHLYRVRDAHIEKRNEDHSYGGYLDRMIAEGAEVESEPGLSRNMLMSAMTGDEIAEVDCPDEGLQLLPGDRIIVASDGVDTLGPERIQEIASRRWSAKECVHELLEAVKAVGNPRQDNTTVVVLDVFELDQPAPVVAKKLTGADKGRTTLQVSAAPAADGTAVAPAVKRPTPAKKPSVAPVIVGVLAVLAVAGGGAWYYLNFMSPAASVVANNGDGAAGTGGEAGSEGQATVEQPPDPASLAPLREFRDTLASGGKGPLMLVVPATAFDMGSSNVSLEADERPRHRVELGPFAIGKFEITIAEYASFAAATKRSARSGRPDEPVRGLSFADAEAYVAWLSEQTGKVYRIPSESEWELVASVGNRQPYWWGRNPEKGRAQCFDCLGSGAPRAPVPVGSYPANPLGLHDTAGNVAEWVADCYHPSYEGAPTDGSVWGEPGCNGRVARGGAWMNTSATIRSTKRIVFDGSLSVQGVGLRVARDP